MTRSAEDNSKKDQAISLTPGTVVAGRYEIVQCLGFGSVGVVYSCFHRDLPERRFAMKFLHSSSKDGSDESGTNSLMGRFRNELMAAYQVNHPNVVRAYDYIEEDGNVAFTMEHVAGGDLWGKIRNSQSLSSNAVVDILSQICSGVQAIHDVGIIHRDLKPENILIASDGTVKISDFGIARIRNGKHFTAHGGVVGTFDYMSPEYLKDSESDERGDIFSIGILGYLLITGQSPFSNKSLVDSIMSRIDFDVVPPHKLNGKCPQTLSSVILKALQPDPANRYQSAGEMLYHLSALRFALHRETSKLREESDVELGSNDDVQAAEFLQNGEALNADQSRKDSVSVSENKDLLPIEGIETKEKSYFPLNRNVFKRRAISAISLACTLGFVIAVGSPVAKERIIPTISAWLKHSFPGIDYQDVYESDPSTPVEKDPSLQRKATLLYKFVNHFSSADNSNTQMDTVNLCILGADPFGSYLDRITSRARTVRNQQYRVRRFAEVERATPTNLNGCTVAFVTKHEEQRFLAAINALGRSNVPVITDGSGNGVVDFAQDESGRVNFHVDAKRAQARGIEIGASLIQIASSSQNNGAVELNKEE